MWDLRIQTQDHVLQAFWSKRQDPVYGTARLPEDSYPKAAAQMVQIEVLDFVRFMYFF